MSDYERFTELVGTDFAVRTLDGPVTIRLDRCRSFGPDDTNSFVLSFTAESGVYLQQGIHQAVSAPLEDASLFLVPVGPAG